MLFETLVKSFGEDGAVALAGLAVGLTFGALAQRSRFCMRSATIEFFRGSIGPKTAVWLLAFAASVAGTQVLTSGGWLDVSNARQLTGQGSLSGAILGGLMFGAGMVLARGCTSRILVLSATGNLRALVTGLILAIIAQSSLRGFLSPAREWIAGLWTISGEAARDLTAVIGLADGVPVIIGIVLFGLALYLALFREVSRWMMAGTIGVGLTIAAGWLVTYSISTQSFNPVSVKSISFIGPSADTLMGFINHPSMPLVFDLGLVPGVFAGSFFAALLGRELKWQCFSIEESPMPRYVIGAVLMGFGGMLAGGCAVGAAMTGTSVFSLTAWVAMLAMWAGGGITDFLVDRRPDAEDVKGFSVEEQLPAE
ncbi:MAG: YeeE/YedE family protein [Alphaproteobacteria bacterium]|nr:YeeE/YedE family protein [Alphaproteobacteria bacterium]